MIVGIAAFALTALLALHDRKVRLRQRQEQQNRKNSIIQLCLTGGPYSWIYADVGAKVKESTTSIQALGPCRHPSSWFPKQRRLLELLGLI